MTQMDLRQMTYNGFKWSLKSKRPQKLEEILVKKQKSGIGECNVMKGIVLIRNRVTSFQKSRSV